MASSCLERHLIPPLFLLFWQTDARKGTKDENFFFFHLHDIESQDCHFFFFFFWGHSIEIVIHVFFFSRTTRFVSGLCYKRLRYVGGLSR